MNIIKRILSNAKIGNFHPETSAEAVLMSNGETLQEALDGVDVRSAQIEENTSTLIKHDKEINDLEVLVAQGSIDTANRNIMLQFNIGIDSMELPYENQFDNFMRLIELNVFDKFDLEMKASNLYMFMQLSDSEYENIMLALNPPVVEDVEEEVENELI